MRTYLELSPTPTDEDCAQVGEPDYRAKATKEMKAYINQLYREFPDTQDEGCEFFIKWFPHEFGSYGYVCVMYTEGNRMQEEYAFSIENNLPYNWDEEALKELNGDSNE